MSEQVAKVNANACVDQQQSKVIILQGRLNINIFWFIVRDRGSCEKAGCAPLKERSEKVVCRVVFSDN